MAESKTSKKQKKPDDFADDLNLMLDLDETSGQQVGLIDDDDAIDRLLMDDAFGEIEGNSEPAESSGLDEMIADELQKDDKFAADFDEFADDADDFLPDIQINPEVPQVLAETKVTPLRAIGEDKDGAPPRLGTAVEIDGVDDENAAISALDKFATGHDELEQMTEIDEFSDDHEESGNDEADFLLADFDISPEPAGRQPTAAKIQPTVVPSADNASFDEFGDDEPAYEAVAAGTENSAFADAASGVEAPSWGETATNEADQAVSSVRIAELAAELAEISQQLSQLNKQQLQLKQQLQSKSNQQEPHRYDEDIEALKTELKKNKRSLDALVIKKPVSAYVANGIAVSALMLGGVLAVQTYIAKVQLGQLAEFLGQLQQQTNAGPASLAAEKEMLHKRLDELALTNSATANQVAELSKALQGDSSSAGGALGQQLEQLNKQDMQIGAAIESLQNKVSALEKGKTVPAVQPAAKKKPAVVQENWQVNLVAFKQDWYAKRKAEEFAAKGVPAKVSRADSKGEIWYRLAVDGFKSQYEAAAYAARVKKTLNLDSVWVAKANH